MSIAAAFETLLAEHFRASFVGLLRKWRRRHVSPQAAEDTIGSAYARIYATYRDKERPPQTASELDRLVHTVIRNELADAYRRQERKSNLEAAAAPEHEADENSDWWERQSRSVPSIDAMALRNLVAEVLSQMSARNRFIMELMLLGFSPQEIGAKLQSQKFYADIRYAKEQFRRMVLVLAKSGNDVADEFARSAFPLSGNDTDPPAPPRRPKGND